MSKKIIPVDVEKALEAMRNIPTPNPEHQIAAKKAFLAQARQMRQAQAVSSDRAIRHSKQLFRQRKEGSLMATTARVAAVLLVLSGAVTGTAFAADASLPGQPLYPLDLRMEQVQAMVATTAQTQANLSLALSAERASEMRALVQAGQVPDQAALERLQNQLKQTLQLAVQLQDQEMIRLLTQLRDMAQEQAGQMKSLGFAQGETVMNRVRELAQNGIDDPASFRLQHRGGRGWEEDQPVATDAPPAATDTPKPVGTPDAANGEQDQERDQQRDQERDQQKDQERDQQQDGTRTPQSPHPTPGNGNGDSGSGNGGSGGSGGGQ